MSGMVSETGAGDGFGRGQGRGGRRRHDRAGRRGQGADAGRDRSQGRGGVPGKQQAGRPARDDDQAGRERDGRGRPADLHRARSRRRARRPRRSFRPPVSGEHQAGPDSRQPGQRRARTVRRSAAEAGGDAAGPGACPLPEASSRLTISSPLAPSSTTRVWTVPAASETLDLASAEPAALTATAWLPGGDGLVGAHAGELQAVGQEGPSPGADLDRLLLQRGLDDPDQGLPGRGGQVVVQTCSRRPDSGPMPATV